MSSLSPKDRASLCSFTFADGRRCLTPRSGKHPRLCFYHAQKEARDRAAKKLGKDLAYFFSGDYLSACDLSAALGRLILAVVRGDVKPKTAHTVAYLAQTLMQAIQVSQHEYCEAFSSNAWRQSVRNSVNGNHDYLFPPDPQPDQSESPQPQPQPIPTLPEPLASACPVRHPERSEGSHPIHATQPAQPTPTPHTSLPPTSAEFVQHVLARLQTSRAQAPQPASTPPSPPAPQPTAVAHPSRGEALRPASPSIPSATPDPSPRVTSRQPVEMPPSCHSEHSEESAFSSFPAPSPTSAHAQTPASHPTPSSPGCHAERSEASHPILATQPAPSAAPLVQPNNPPQTSPPAPQPTRTLDARALHFDHSCRLLVDGKPF